MEVHWGPRGASVGPESWQETRRKLGFMEPSQARLLRKRPGFPRPLLQTDTPWTRGHRMGGHGRGTTNIHSFTHLQARCRLWDPHP